MTRVGRFEKVSFEQFKAGMEDFGLSEEVLKEKYERIQLPLRATSGSAGYDIRTTVDIELEPGQTIKVPTGIRVSMLEDWMLAVFPRSGLGFKFRLQLNNTVGIIDSDYYFSDNDIFSLRSPMTPTRVKRYLSKREMHSRRVYSFLTV